MEKQPIEFHAITWSAEDLPDDEGTPKYIIKVFGRSDNGQSVSASIVNFKPFFYIKIKKEWESNIDKTKIYKNLLSILGDDVNIELVHRKDFWGFNNNTIFNFFKVEFLSLAKCRQSVSKLGKVQNIIGLGKHKYELYEANFEPFIRFIHIKKLLPTGWIKISKYSSETDYLTSNCNIDIECEWKNVEPLEKIGIAPFIVASFDIECTSSGGEFPVPIKTHKHFSTQLYEIFKILESNISCEYTQKETLINCIKYALGLKDTCNYLISKIIPKIKQKDDISPIIEANIDDIFAILRSKGTTFTKDHKINSLTKFFLHAKWLGPLEGDSIIQIGTTFHTYGSKTCYFKHIITLGDCKPIDGATVESYNDERQLLLAWQKLIIKIDPDIITGYNIFGFDFHYMYDRTFELGITKEFMQLSRVQKKVCKFKEQKLSSSALGDNILKYIAMDGRVLVDLMKVVQRDHKLDSYKLDNVAQHFTGEKKNDVSPKEIFELQKGNSDDRKRIAEYCIQDCELCNRLIIKLEIVANNMGMSNVCIVPMEYIFMRGQGIKIFSLVLNECRKNKFLIPVLRRSVTIKKDTLEKLPIPDDKKNAFEKEIKKIEKALQDETRFEGHNYANSISAILQVASQNTSVPDLNTPMHTIYPYINQRTVNELATVIRENLESGLESEYNDDSYEGAIVLPPKQAIYIDTPVSVLDYASLYPSSMISENLSHDCIVIDPAYDNLPGIEYLDISYDIYKPGTKEIIGKRNCRYVQGQEKGVIPKILMKLLDARKTTRKRMELKKYNNLIGTYKNQTFVSEDGQHTFNDVASIDIQPAFNEFELAVLDGLQVAYKVTANSLYGQIGAKTSQIYLKDIAACTTATGRKMILHAKQFLENNYNADIVYGDTDSIFCTFPAKKTGRDAIMPSIQSAIDASKTIKSELKFPHDLEYEKTFWPFILLSKKRYVGNVYEKDDVKFKQKSMGIVLKRRDNANIVKKLYGGVIDIILTDQNLLRSIEFLTKGLNELIKGKVSHDDLVISKSLRADYKDETKIAHKVLANRIAERDPGNKPQINDRIPYIYIKTCDDKALQGERIESPDFIEKNDLTPDYGFYITNQIMKPILQLYALEVQQMPGFKSFPEDYLQNIQRNLLRELKDQEKAGDKFDEIKEVIVKQLVFDPVLKKIENIKIKKSLLIKKYSKYD